MKIPELGQTWIRSEDLWRLDKILATDLNNLTLLFLSAAMIYFALEVIEKNVKCRQIDSTVPTVNGKRKLLATKSIFFALKYVYCGLVLTVL